jgi:hypothetical protein
LLRKNDFEYRLCGNVESSERAFELLHYPKFLLKRDYPRYDIDNQFTVVRDPVDRFLSGVGYHEISDLFKLSRMSYHEFKGYLEDHMSHNPKSTQILVPQHWFVDDKVHTYKYENGLGNPLRQFLEDTFNINSLEHSLPMDFRPSYKHNRDPHSLSKHRNLMPVRLIDNIISYYERDYEIFGYEPTRYP